ncbi:MAG: hypothetical protein M0C28_46230 [Candidatus Moduliflexus flocculans]|nr:hypothetical protein [Candidatus Moduliflexus flocculans]
MKWWDKGYLPALDPVLVRDDHRRQPRCRARALERRPLPESSACPAVAALRRRPGPVPLGQGGQSRSSRASPASRPTEARRSAGTAPTGSAVIPATSAGSCSGWRRPSSSGSYWAFLPQAAAVVLLLGRTFLEDRMLKKDLLWYEEYAKTVRFRLVPGIW